MNTKFVFALALVSLLVLLTISYFSLYYKTAEVNPALYRLTKMPDQVECEGTVYAHDPYWEDYESISYADLDGDGTDEAVVRFVSNGEMPHDAVTAIYSARDGYKNPVKTVIGGEHPRAIDMADIDKDGIKDLVIYDHSGNHYTEVLIYSFKDGDYRCLFRNGTACYLYSVDTEADPTRIIIGRENWENEEFCYASSATESLEAVWEWRGGAFVFSPKLSTSDFETEKEAIETTWQHINNMDISSESASNEYAMKGWIAGKRSTEVFREEREKEIAEYNAFIEECAKRLDIVNEELDKSLFVKEKAELYAEKAWLLLVAFGEDTSMVTATNCLLHAVELAPEDAEKRHFLKEVYKRLWSDKYFNDKSEASKGMKTLKDKARAAAYYENNAGL